MKYTVVLQLSGTPAEAVAVEWTDAAAPAASGAGWEPCIGLGDARWRFSSHDLAAAERPHLRGQGPFDNIGIRYRLEPAGSWSAVSEDRKEITILDLEGETGQPPGPSDPDPDPVPPVPAAPALLAAPFLAGEGKIGAAMRVDPGLWSGEPSDFALVWCRDGDAIEGAVEAEYVPAFEDDLTEFTCQVTATGQGGSAEAVTAPLAITHVAPAAKGGLFDEVFDEGTGPQTVDAAADFTGEALVFAVAGGEATIDAATGLVGIPTDRPVSGEAVTVTAANSGGEAASSFMVTVEAAPAEVPGEPAEMPALGAGEWEIVDLVEDPVHRGMVTAVLRITADGPAAGAIAAYWDEMADGRRDYPHPCVALGPDDEGRPVFRMSTFNPNTQQWHCRAPGESLGNISLRYQLLAAPTAYPSAEHLPLIGPNSLERLGFAVPADFFTPVAAPPAETAGPAPTASRSSIDLGGSVLTLSAARQCGQYQDGSWFIVNPSGAGGVTITSWTPNAQQRSSGSHSGTWCNGVMVNPARNRNGFDQARLEMNSDYIGYHHDDNRAPNLRGNIGFAAGAQGSVVKAIGAQGDLRANKMPFNWLEWVSPVQRMHVVTIVHTVPPAGAFRPSAAAQVSSKAPLATVSDIDFTRIPSLAIPAAPTSSAGWGHCTIANARHHFGGGPWPTWQHGNIRERSIAARDSCYGAHGIYGLWTSQMLQAALMHVYSPVTSQADREAIVRGICQVGLEFHQNIEAGLSGGMFHGPTFRWIYLITACLMKNATLRTAMLARRSAGWGAGNSQWRVIGNHEITEQVASVGRSAWLRAIRGRDFWAWDQPWQEGHRGMVEMLEWGSVESAAESAGWDRQKGGFYHLERASAPVVIEQIAGMTAAIADPREVQWGDRVVRAYDGHYDGRWTFQGDIHSEEFSSGFGAPMCVGSATRAFYNAHRARIPTPAWAGQPEQPAPPILTRLSGSSIRVEALRFRPDNGSALSAMQVRYRRVEPLATGPGSITIASGWTRNVSGSGTSFGAFFQPGDVLVTQSLNATGDVTHGITRPTTAYLNYQVVRRVASNTALELWNAAGTRESGSAMGYRRARWTGTGPSWTTLDRGAPPASGTFTFDVGGLAGGLWQVQIRYRNAVGWGPWSTNVPARSDQTYNSRMGRQPAGFRAQITV